MSDKKYIVYVYGTLRPGNTKTELVPGVLYDLGWFPGIDLKAPDCGTFVVAEKLIIDEKTLEQYDRYEGYEERDPVNSLYKRVPYLDGWIYVYNKSFAGHKPIPLGDWREYRKEEQLKKESAA